MRTTLQLDPELMREAKQRAAATGRTLTDLIERAVRDLLAREQALEQGGDFNLDWTAVAGGVQPGVDLTDRDTLYERMERDG